MSHTIQLPDAVYQAIAAYAAKRGQTPEEAIEAWAEGMPAGIPAQAPSIIEPVYDPADDPLAEFLGTGELTEPDALLHHDVVIGEETLDEHRD